MSFQHVKGVGMVHFNEVKPARVVPGNERHRWADKHVAWGESTTCTKCGCEKHRRKTQPDYTEVFRMPGGPEQSERPACTGKKAEVPVEQPSDLPWLSNCPNPCEQAQGLPVCGGQCQKGGEQV